MQRRPWGAEATFLFLLFLTVFTPLSPLAAVMAPIPLVLLFAADQWKRVIILGFAAFFAAWLTGLWLPITLFLLAVTSFAYLLGRGLRRNEMGHHAVYATLVCISVLILMLAFAKWTGVNIIGFITQVMQQSIRVNPQIATLGDMTPQALMKELTQQLQLLLPGSIVVLATMITLLNLAIVRLVRGLTHSEDDPILSAIRMPQSAVAVYLVAYMAILLNWGVSTPLLWQLINNTWLITTFLFSIQALSYLWWLMRKKRYGIPVMVLALFLNLLPVLGDLFVLIGLLDAVFNLRTRRKRRK